MAWEAVTEGWGVTGADEVAAAAAGVTWTALSLGTDGPTVRSDGGYDPNSLWVSTVDHGGGEHTITQNRVGQHRGTHDGWSMIVPLPAGFTSDGDSILLLRITRIDLAPTNSTSGIWAAMSLHDNGANPTAGNCLGPGFRWSGSGTKWYVGRMTRTTINQVATTLADADRTAIGTICVADDFATSNEMASSVVTAAKVTSGSTSAAMVGSTHAILISGGNYITDTAGNASMRWKFEVAVVPSR